MRIHLMRGLLTLSLAFTMLFTVFAQESIDAGDSVAGTANGENVDYNIELADAQSIAITLTSVDFDTYIEVRDGNTVLAFNDDGGSGTDSALEFAAPSAGTFTIRVRSFIGAPSGNFTLSIEARGSGSTTTTTTTGGGEGTIGIGETVEGRASGNQPEYTVELASGDNILVNLMADDFDPYLEIRDANGSVLDSDDDGGDGFNSRLLFTAPSSGTYILRVRSFSGDADGGFTLSVETSSNVSNMQGGELTYGNTISVEPNGALSISFSFTAAAGDVINLYAISEGSEDSRLYLYAPSGETVGEDDDGGEGTNPYLRRLSLAEAGEYRVELQGFGENPLFETINVTLEQTEMLDLNNGSVVVSLGSDVESETLTLDVSEGSTYIITISWADDLESSFYGDITEAGADFAGTTFSFSGVQQIAFVYSPDESGTARMALNYYSFSENLEITVELEKLD